MQIRDAHILRLIERIGDHYQVNIASRFIRPVLHQLPLEKQSWDLIEILTEKIDQYRYQGFDLEYLYRQIIATARFVSLCRRDIVHNLRNRVNAIASDGGDKVIRDMAVNNFAANLQVFADLVNELFIGLVELDKQNAKGRRPLYMQLAELEDIGRLLIEH